jgi:hypothetical protein
MLDQKITVMLLQTMDTLKLRTVSSEDTFSAFTFTLSSMKARMVKSNIQCSLDLPTPHPTFFGIYRPPS